jgi:CHAT domain-containing protein
MKLRLFTFFIFCSVQIFAQSNGYKKWILDAQNAEKNGKYEQAFECYNKALLVSEGALSQNTQESASFYYAISKAAFQSGEWRKGVPLGEKAIEKARTVFGNTAIELANCYNVTANCYWNLHEDNNQMVLNYYQKAIEIIQKISPIPYDELYHYQLNIAGVYSDMMQYEKAIEHYKLVLNYTIKEKNDSLRIDVLFYMGWTYNDMKKYELAADAWKESGDLAKKIFGNIHSETASIKCYEAKAWFNAKKYDKIDTLIESALISANFNPQHLEECNSIGDAVFKSFSLLTANALKKYEQNNDPNTIQEGLIAYKNAQLVSNYYKKRLLQEEEKRDWAKVCESSHKSALQLAFLMNSKEGFLQAFDISEQKKSTILQNSIQSSRNDFFNEEEKKLKTAINFWEKELALKSEHNALASDEIKHIYEQILVSYNALESLMSEVQRKNPAFYDAKYSSKTANIKEIQAILNNKQAVLDYATADNMIYVFIITKNNFEVKSLKKEVNFAENIKKFRTALQNTNANNAQLEEATATYSALAQQLYQSLFAPIAADLPTELIIIPDEELNYIPFEALLTDAPTRIGRFKTYPYLLKKHTISYCYSATLWKEFQEKKSNATKKLENFAAFAPSFSNDNHSIVSLNRTLQNTFKPLKNNKAEAEEIAAIMNGKTWIGEAATEENFVNEAANYRILHISTHGKADDRAGDYSFLAFQNIPDDQENELLYVKDIYNLQINSDLVTLSACETGIGEYQKGEGVIGLSRAFSMVGAKSLLTTLWSIDDATSKDLLVDFYKKLSEGSRKDEALHNVKLNYIEKTPKENGVYASPFYWAAFIGIGNMERID